MPPRLPELDGIRGIAILAVVGFHFRAWSNGLLPAPLRAPLSVGWIGVDLFFVLSGFLITGILLDLRDNPERLKVFYVRRAARILPLYYAAIALFFYFTPVPSGEQAWYWLHVSNWHTAFAPLTYPMLSHFWSLAIEEQFYALWPFLVWSLSRNGLLRAAIIGIVACVALRNLPTNQAINAVYDNYLYRLTPFRVDGLLMGAIVALAYRDKRLEARLMRYRKPVGLSSLAAFFACMAITKTFPQSGAMTRLGYTALALAFAATVAHAVFAGGSPGLCAMFRHPVLRSFGKYSYFIYIAHAAVLTGFLHPIQEFLGGGTLAALAAGLCCLAIMYALAVGSWYAFEKRFIEMAPRATATGGHWLIPTSSRAVVSRV